MVINFQPPLLLYPLPTLSDDLTHGEESFPAAMQHIDNEMLVLG
jgi:hypothetical protein